MKIFLIIILFLIISTTSFFLTGMGCFSEYSVDETTSKSKTTISEVIADSEATTSTKLATSDSTKTSETRAEIDANLIHGVVPAEVAIHSSSTDKFGEFETTIEFWNVGSLGGEQYAQSIYKVVLIEKAEGIQGPENGFKWIYEGTFTGGPNGDFNLAYTSEGGATIKVHLKLKDGKEIISDDGTITPFDNSEVFEGWID